MLTPYAHRQQVDLLERTLTFLRDNPPPRCCLNCVNFKAGTCVTFGPIAPEHQQTPGCPEWDEEIPF